MAEEPMAEEPMAEEPMAEEPMAAEPMAAEPMAAEPMAAELGFERGLPDADGFRAGALNEGELRLLDGLESPSLTSAPEPEVIKPGELVSALVRILIRKGYMAEAELIEELQRR